MTAKDKWYNNREMVGGLLLFWPPIGLYATFKSETIEPKWKKVIYGTFALASILLLVTELA